MSESKPPPLIEVVTTPDGRRGLRLNFHPGQQRAWDSTKRVVLVLAGVRSGKTSFGPPFVHREMQQRGPIDALVAAGRTVEVSLGEALPVYIAYFTAAPAADGTIAVLPDIYGRDQAASRPGAANVPCGN